MEGPLEQFKIHNMSAPLFSINGHAVAGVSQRQHRLTVSDDAHHSDMCTRLPQVSQHRLRK